jgi:nucleotide-binding universal stress UspA family protein
MYKHILVPLENSPTDETILKHVSGLAQFCGARVTLVHVADGFVARNIENLNLSDSEEMRLDSAYLDSQLNKFLSAGIDGNKRLLCGDPAIEIEKLAGELGVDLIAMATHGHRLVKDFILGSVANELRHRTNVPILMIRAERSRE